MAANVRSLLLCTAFLTISAGCASPKQAAQPTPASAPATQERQLASDGAITSDEQAAGILARGCEKLIAESAIGAKRAKNDDVRLLAQAVGDTCKFYNANQAALLVSLGTSEASSPLSERLQSLTLTDTGALARSDAPDFDRRFLFEMIADIGAFGVIIGDHALPLVQRPQLDALINAQLVPALLAHFAETRRLIEGRQRTSI